MEEKDLKEKIERIKPEKPAHFGRKVLLVLAVLFLIIVGSSSIVVTYENEYTLIREFGKVERVVSTPGISFKIPFIQTTGTLPKYIQMYDMARSDVITSEKKTMVADCYVLWKISEPKLFVQTLNGQIANAENRINTTVYNSIKNVISSMEQSEVISGRAGELAQAIRDHVGNTMDQYGIDIVTIETKALDLPIDNKEAVYERMISERNNIAAAYTAEGQAEATKIRTSTDQEITVSESEAEADAEKIRAEGEAEYMNILSKAYSDESKSDFYTFVRALDAAKKSLTGDKTIILNSDSPLAQIFNNVE